MSNNVMIDIETLSSKPDAAVVSIGLAAFDVENGVTDTCEIVIKRQHIYGRISADTVVWWMGFGKNAPGDEARKATFGSDNTVTAYMAALTLREFIDRHGGRDCLMWANAPQFDVTIMRNWWATMPDRLDGIQQGTVRDQPFPISYRNERDCRTIFEIGRQLGVDTTDCWLGVGHSAIDDATNQARAVVKIQRELDLVRREARA